MALVPGWTRYPKRHDVVVVPSFSYKGVVEKVEGYHRVVSFMDDLEVRELAEQIRRRIPGQYPHKRYCEVTVAIGGEPHRFSCFLFFYEESDGEE